MNIFGLNNTEPSQKAPNERLTAYEKPFVQQYVRVVDVSIQTMDALFSRKPINVAPSVMTKQAIFSTEQAIVPTNEPQEVAQSPTDDPAELARRQIAAIHAASPNPDQGLAA